MKTGRTITMTIQTVIKDWGFEEIIVNTDKYCLKRITCRDKRWSSKGKYHYHPVKDETFYVIDGTLEMDVEQPDGAFANFYLFTGKTYRVPPTMKHKFRSVGDKCVFYEVSTHDDPKDTVRCWMVEKGHKNWAWVEE